MSLRDRSCVTGIGETTYLRGATTSAFELQIEASLKAVADAGLKPTEIDGVNIEVELAGLELITTVLDRLL